MGKLPNEGGGRLSRPMPGVYSVAMLFLGALRLCIQSCNVVWRKESQGWLLALLPSLGILSVSGPPGIAEP